MPVKTQVTIVAFTSDASVVGKIVDQNIGDQAVWNGRVVAVYVTARTVLPNLGVSRLADAHLKPGDVVTLTFVPDDYDAARGAYPALAVGREMFLPSGR